MDAPPLHERTFSRTLPHKRGWCRAVIGMGLAHHCLYLIFTVTSFEKFVNTQKWWVSGEHLSKIPSSAESTRYVVC